MDGPLETLRGAYQVSRRSLVVAEGAAGVSDENSGEACTLSTRFAAASVGKQFVAASAMMLVERGALSLEDPVGRWWPPASPRWDAITIGHLLSHTSGLPHWDDLPGIEVSSPPGPEAILEHAAGVPLLAPPGTRWAYSGVGYLLAAAIVEAASGEAYGAFVSSNVFRPLGMTSTSTGVVPEAGRAAGHRDGQPVPLVAGITALAGTGDVWTTVGDLTRYANAVGSGAVLSEQSWQLMVRPHARLDNPAAAGGVSVTGYGYGVYVGAIAGKSILFHPGDNPGFRSLLVWLPETEITFAGLSNEESAALDDIALHLLRTINN